jgi:glycosyltransferase involved in cell wall biosynthesis
MKIAINALTVREGGGLVALEKLLSQFVRLKPEYEYYIIASKALPRLRCMEHETVHRCHFVWAERNLPMLSLWYLAVLPAWLQRNRVDVLFSQTCYLPPLSLKRTALLVQDARYFYKTPAWSGPRSITERMAFKLRRLWVHRSVAAADEVTVQTQAVADLIGGCIPSASERIRVIPHGPGYLDKPCPRPIRHLNPSDTFEIVYVALYREHKNFTTLVEAVKLLRSWGIPVRLHLTLDRNKPEVIDLERQMQAMGVAEWIVNHGQLDRSAVTGLYENSHIFVFPSICESFGFPQVEAMAFGLPIIAADTRVNREVCGSAAVFFPPDDADALAHVVERFYCHPEELALASRRSAQRSFNFDWSKAGGETLGWMTNGKNHKDC